MGLKLKKLYSSTIHIQEYNDNEEEANTLTTTQTYCQNLFIVETI